MTRDGAGGLRATINCVVVDDIRLFRAVLAHGCQGCLDVVAGEVLRQKFWGLPSFDERKPLGVFGSLMKGVQQAAVFGVSLRKQIGEEFLRGLFLAGLGDKRRYYNNFCHFLTLFLLVGDQDRACSQRMALSNTRS